jgi:hypothetical protein
MRRPALHVLFAAGVLLLAGCGGKTTATRAATSTPRLTSPADVAACNQLETSIRIVSQLISSSVQAMTQSLHPKELARRTGITQRNLLYAATALSRLQTPAALAGPQSHLIDGLRLFAADFGRASRSVGRNDLETAARQLVDRRALAEVSAATAKIDRACGA